MLTIKTLTYFLTVKLKITFNSCIKVKFIYCFKIIKTSLPIINIQIAKNERRLIWSISTATKDYNGGTCIIQQLYHLYLLYMSKQSQMLINNISLIYGQTQLICGFTCIYNALFRLKPRELFLSFRSLKTRFQTLRNFNWHPQVNMDLQRSHIILVTLR